MSASERECDNIVEAHEAMMKRGNPREMTRFLEKNYPWETVQAINTVHEFLRQHEGDSAASVFFDYTLLFARARTCSRPPNPSGPAAVGFAVFSAIKEKDVGETLSYIL
jgi:hypothetical protein